MPFKSESQRRFMFSQHPEIAKEFQAATPPNAKLPEHVPEKMAEGGTPSPVMSEPGLKDATVSDFLLPYLLGPSAKMGAEAAGPALEGLGETGAATLGAGEGEGLVAKAAERLAPKMEDDIAGATTNDVVTPAVGDTVSLRSTTPGMPDLNVKYNGPMMKDSPGLSPELKEMAKQPMFNLDKDVPAHAGDVMHPTNSTVAKSTLEARGYRFPNSYAKGGMAFPHVTFLENESPAQVKKDVHMEGHEAGPMNTTETGEKENPKHLAKGGTIHKAEDRNKEPAKPKDVEMSHEKKLASIYKAMGVKKYADGGVSASDETATTPSLPTPSDPTYWDQIKNMLGQVKGAVGTTLENSLPATSGLNAAIPTMPGAAAGAADVATSPGLIPAINAGLGTDLKAPETAAMPPAPPAAPPAAPAPAMPPAPPAIPGGAPAASTTTAGMPNLGNLFNQDTSKLTAGVNPEDRQALVNKLQGQQHGLGAIIAQAVAGIGDAFSAKGGKETHALGNIFSMQKEQRDEALANFDKMRQDRIQKLQLQTQMGDNALKQAAAVDAYGVDDHLNGLLNAPKGTMKKDLPTYMGIMSSQIAAKEKDEDLYMKSHAQASTDVDNAVKNASILSIKPSAAQLQAGGQKLADGYYNKAKGNVPIKASDGSQHWIPAANIGKAKQMDPGLQVMQ
jgi:hypothetical protein